MKDKLLRLDDRRFYKELLSVDSKTRKFNKVSIIDLVNEFEKRKFLNPDIKGGICIQSSSIILKKRSDNMFPKIIIPDKRFVHSTEEIMKFFEVTQSLLPKRDYYRREKIDEKQSVYERMLEESRMREEFEFMLKTEDDIKQVNDFVENLTKARMTEVKKMFNRGQLNLLLDKLAMGLKQKRIKLKKTNNIQGIEYLDDCTIIKKT